MIQEKTVINHGNLSNSMIGSNAQYFGVVKLDDYGFITDFVEKPKTFVSDLAIIGIYYFKSAEKLMEEINYIMSNDIKVGGEYQLTTALENLRQKGEIGRAHV